MFGDLQSIEVYSAFLRIKGQIVIIPGQRLSEMVNRLNEDLELFDAVTEPLSLSKEHPLISPKEERIKVLKHSVIMVVPGSKDEANANKSLWKEKTKRHVVLNTSAFSLEADIHLEPIKTAEDLEYLLRPNRVFFPVTGLGAMWVPSTGEKLFIRSDFALINPASVVSYALRDGFGDTVD